MALVHPVFYPYPFSLTLTNNVLTLGPLGQLSNLSGSTYQVEDGAV